MLFTAIGIFIVIFLVYMLLFGLGMILLYDKTEDTGFNAVLFVGIIISIVLTTFICFPESYGYQKITVSENTVELQESGANK